MPKKSKKCRVKQNLKVCNDLEVKDNTELEGNVRIDKNLTVKGKTTLRGGLKVQGGETVDDLTVDNLTVNDSLIIPRIDITTVSPVGKQADLVYDISDTFVNDNQVHISDGKEWLTLPANPVGGVYTIGVDFPTIQSGIDYCSSGLKPVANSNLVQPLPPGVKNVTLNIPKGLYRETIFIDISFSIPFINDPATDINNLQGRGLRLIGDTRPIVAMSYMNGGLLLSNRGPGLGHFGGQVTLINSDHTITVISSINPQPNFGVAEVVAGDIIAVTDTNGNIQQRNVVSVLGNTVTYDGDPVSISGNGATLTFFPNVQVMSSVPDAICFIAGGYVEMVGIWFSGDPNFADSAIYGLAPVGYCQLYFLNLLIDCRNLLQLQNGILPSLGARILGISADNDIIGQMTILAGSLHAFDGFINQGQYYILAPPNPDQVFSGFSLFEAGGFVDSVQINGANAPDYIAFQADNVSNMPIGTLGLFNCPIGLDCNLESRLGITNLLTLDTCETGIQLTNASSLAVSGNIIYSNVTTPYAIDATSTISTVHNTGTDPSPNNIFTYFASGVQTMNSAYLNQRLNPGDALVISLQLDPSATVNDVKIYQGKTYTLTKVSGGAHTLTLTTGSFLGSSNIKTFMGGPGSTMTILVVSDTEVDILTSTGVM